MMMSSVTSNINAIILFLIIYGKNSGVLHTIFTMTDECLYQDSDFKYLQLLQ